MEESAIYLGALEFAPRIATHLGLYIGQYTSFEIALISMYKTASGLSASGMAESLFGRIINVSTRIDLIDDALRVGRADIVPRSAERLKVLCKRARNINSRRNQLVHGAYRVHSKTGAVSLLPWALSTARTTTAELLTVERLQADITEIREFLGELIDLYGGTLDELSPPLPEI